MLIGKPKSQAGIRTGNVTRSYRRKPSHRPEELEKIFFHNFISGNLKQDPKRFFSDVKK